MSNAGAQHYSKQFIDGNGNPYSGVKVYHTAAGTDTLKNVWTDEGKVTPAANPVVGDSRGMVSFYADGDYKLVIKDTDNVTLYTWDNVKITSDTATLWEGNAGTAYPSAAAANRFQQFVKHNASNEILEIGINKGSAFMPLTLGIYASAFASFTDAVTAAANRILIIDASINLPAGAITIPSNVSVYPIQGGVINKSSATSLTINAPMVGNPMHQWLNGFAAGEVTFGVNSVYMTQPFWWQVNSDPGITDMTIAINCSIKAGRSVLIDGIHGTTGLHRITNDFQNQLIIGVNNGTLKKLSGTSYILDTTHGAHRVGMKNLRFDGNSLDGIAVIWRAHYSTLENIYVENVTGTYGMRISGVNLSNFSNVTIQNVHSGLLISQSGDTGVSPTPTYGCLYSSFNNIISVPTTGPALKLAGSQVQALLFTDLYIESAGFTLTTPTVYLTDGPIADIHFKNLKGEYGILTNSFIKADTSDVYNIHFNGGRISTGYAQTIPVFDFVNTNDYSVKNILFLSTPSSAGRNYIKLTGTRQGLIENNVVYSTTDFSFINDVSGNYYITERNNGHSRDGINWPGKGTNTWTTATPLTIDNSQFTQIYSSATMQPINPSMPFLVTLADDTSYNIHGDGGISAAGDFSGVITIGTWGAVAADKNNFATFYAQVSSGSGSQLNTPISVGSNVEILNNADNTSAVLSTTTDGKLGVQIGYVGGGANRYIKLYNRTGASITLFIRIEQLGGYLAT